MTAATPPPDQATDSIPAAGSGRVPACPVLPAGLVIAYADAALAADQAWSVEAHLPGCPSCRAVLAGVSDGERLAANRAVLLVRAGLPAPGPAAWLLRRCGLPEHVSALLAATPSLRRSWLAGVVLVLAAVVGSAQLAALHLTGPAGPVPGGLAGWAPLVPFLVVGPLLPLAAVAAAFSAILDPARDLAVAAPVSKVWLLCVRSVAVVAATLLPTMAAGLILPGPWWLPAALLLPALAVCAAGLAAATVLPPVPAAVGAGAGWVALVLGITMAADKPAIVVGPGGQLCALAVLAAAAALLAARRRRIDIDWMG